MYAVELVYGERHTVLRSRNTFASSIYQIPEGHRRRDFAIDRLFVVYHLLRRLLQRLHRQVINPLSVKISSIARLTLTIKRSGLPLFSSEIPPFSLFLLFVACRVHCRNV